MKTRIYSTTLLWLFSALAIVSAASFHASAEDIVIDSVSKAYQVAKDVQSKFPKSQARLSEVELFHVGPVFPAELEALADKFQASGVKVFRHHITLKALEAKLDNGILKTYENEAESAAQLLVYQNGGIQKPEETKKLFKQHYREARDKFRQFLGVPNGMSFAYYKFWKNPEWRPKTKEYVFGFGKALLMSQVIYHAVLKSSVSSGIALNAPAAVTMGVTWGLFFDLLQRGNSAFKGQGLSYEFVSGQSFMNKKFFFVWAAIHTIAMRQSMMAAAHLTADGFTMTPNDSFRALSTSLIGLMGRVPVEMVIEKIRQKHGNNKEIGANVLIGWGLIYSALQAADMFSVQTVFGLHVGEFFRYTLITFGTIGMGITVYLQRAPLIRWFGHIRDWLVGNVQAKREQCQTLLIYRAKP